MTLLTETRPIRVDPELQSFLDELLEPYKGKERDAAVAAVLKIYKSNAQGSFAELCMVYRDAVRLAVA